MQFDHLKKFEGQATARLDMPELGDDAWIEVRQASEKNKPYYNAMLRMSGKRVRKLARGRIDPADVAKNRAEDRILFPKHIITGWGKVEEEPDPENPTAPVKYIEYTQELAVELCDKLPVHLFDRVRNFAATPEEFYPDEMPPDERELAENS